MSGVGADSSFRWCARPLGLAVLFGLLALMARGLMIVVNADVGVVALVDRFRLSRFPSSGESSLAGWECGR